METIELYTQFIMYYEIYRLRNEEGFSVRGIAKQLKINFRTVKKYLKMTLEDFELFLMSKSERHRLLAPYETFVVERLKQYQETGAAQMHDWLKENNLDFPDVPPRTVFNFVMWVRQNHDLPKLTVSDREFEEVIELPFSKQAQVDFGQTTLRRTDGGRQKVHFFVMVLSRSRMRFIWFQTEPFTAHTAIMAHEKAFAFLGGIPLFVVYDQDAVFLVDENIGDLVLVEAFRSYVACRPFKTYFCRKEDPQSKGKVEVSVKFVKRNFLFNRPFSDLETLNSQALAWLDRTGNGQVHYKTHLIPKLAWLEERPTLQTYVPIPDLIEPPKAHNVLITNVLIYRGNTYSLPTGTYKGRETGVFLREEEGMLLIHDKNGGLIASHRMPSINGQQVFNTSHRRDKAEAINKIKENIRDFFGNHPLVEPYMEKLNVKYPRYMRDQLSSILKESSKVGKETSLKSLEYCVNNGILSANDYKSVLIWMSCRANTAAAEASVKMMTPESSILANAKPARSSISTYDSIFQSGRP